MKVGDLVRCIWQPGTAGHVKGVGCIPMKYRIKGELGFIVKQRLEVDHHSILFPRFGYVHTLSPGAFEVISETS